MIISFFFVNMKIFNLKDKLEYLDEVVNLEHDEWGINPDNDRERRISNKKKKILDNLDNRSFCKLILLDKDILVGFISMFPEDNTKYENLSPWYATMYVKKEYRGKGYSKILNDAIIKETKNKGFKTLYLKSTLKNYYEKFGAVFIENIEGEENLFKIDL